MTAAKKPAFTAALLMHHSPTTFLMIFVLSALLCDDYVIASVSRHFTYRCLCHHSAKQYLAFPAGAGAGVELDMIGTMTSVIISADAT